MTVTVGPDVVVGRPPAGRPWPTPPHPSPQPAKSTGAGYRSRTCRPRSPSTRTPCTSGVRTRSSWSRLPRRATPSSRRSTELGSPSATGVGAGSTSATGLESCDRDTRPVVMEAPPLSHRTRAPTDQVGGPGRSRKRTEQERGCRNPPVDLFGGPGGHPSCGGHTTPEVPQGEVPRGTESTTGSTWE